jgi:hypothetical protein
MPGTSDRSMISNSAITRASFRGIAGVYYGQPAQAKAYALFPPPDWTLPMRQPGRAIPRASRAYCGIASSANSQLWTHPFHGGI